MVTARRFATFNSDFPDDTVWDAEEQHVVQTGGKNVTEAIAELMVGFGCIIIELEDDLEHCWDCRFSYEGLRLGIHVWSFDECMFVLDEPLRLGRNFSLFCEVLLKLDEALRRDSRFHDLEWHTYDGANAGKEAYEVPVVDDIPTIEETKQKRGFLTRLLRR